MADTQTSDPGPSPGSNTITTIPRTSVSPQQPASIEQRCEETMDAIIYDVSEPLVHPPSSSTTAMMQEEHLSPLHRMAEIALATSPNMHHSRPGAYTGNGNASSSEKRDGAEEFVLPSQQYYQSGAALLLPASSTPATQQEGSHANTATEDQPEGDGDAEDPLNHRYTHFKLQPKNKSPPSFRVVQLKSGPVTSSISTTGSNPVDGDVAPYAGGSANQEARDRLTTSPAPIQHTYIGQHVPSVSAPDDHDGHASKVRNPPYTDPIPHAHLHPYPPNPQIESGHSTGHQVPVSGSWSAATSPVMSQSHPQSYPAYQTHVQGGGGNGLQPQQQQHQQNRLSIFDLVAAAEVSERESAVFQQQQQQQVHMEVDAIAHGAEMNGNGLADAIEQGNDVNKEGMMNVDVPHSEKKQSTSNRKKSTATGAKKKTSAAATTTNPTTTSAITDAAGDTGIIGHIPLRENSRSISKLLWAEHGAPVAENQDESVSVSTDVKAEQLEAVPVPTKGKKRQSNGALKSLSGQGDTAVASSSSARSKGKKKTDRVAEEMVEHDESAVAETSQPKKKGRKNETSTKSQRKNTKNRSGSLDSTSVADKKANGLGKQKSVQIQEEPEYFEPVAATSGRKGRGRAVTPEPIEEEEEEDNTLYCICKKSFSEDSSTMVECDVCQNWYHIACIGVAEEDIGLLDQYVCPVCEKDPSVTMKTCCKDKCQREGCKRPGRGALSKFCSDTCGVHYALGRLKTNKVKPSQVINSLSTVIKPEGIAIPIPSSGHVNGLEDIAAPNGKVNSNGIDATAASTLQPFQDRTARARLADAEETAETRRIYEARKQEIEQSLEQLAKRDLHLKLAIEQADALHSLHQVDETEEAAALDVQVEAEVPEAEGKKSKRKKTIKRGKTTAATGKVAADERPCGFDLRFIDEDALGEVAAPGDDGALARDMDGDAEMRNADLPSLDQAATVCLAPRKKCDRHAGWQKLRAADLDLMRGNLTQQLELVNKRLEACGESISTEPILVNGTA